MINCILSITVLSLICNSKTSFEIGKLPIVFMKKDVKVNKEHYPQQVLIENENCISIQTKMKVFDDI